MAMLTSKTAAIGAHKAHENMAVLAFCVSIGKWKILVSKTFGFIRKVLLNKLSV